MATQTTTINMGNPEQEALDLQKQLNPAYIANFKLAMEAVSPGSSKAAADAIGSMVRGELPLDVQKQLIQSSAELNLTQGRYGEAANFSTMRNLGVASSTMQQQGLAQLKSLMPQLPDLDTLIQNQRAYDTQRAGMQLQESQFGRSQAQQLSEFQATNALNKLQLSLAQQQQAFTQQMDTQTFDWNKSVVDYNRKYQAYKDQYNQNMSKQLMDIYRTNATNAATKNNAAMAVVGQQLAKSATASTPFPTQGQVFSGLGEAVPPRPGPAQTGSVSAPAATAAPQSYEQWYDSLFGQGAWSSFGVESQPGSGVLKTGFGVFDPSGSGDTTSAPEIGSPDWLKTFKTDSQIESLLSLFDSAL